MQVCFHGTVTVGLSTFRTIRNRTATSYKVVRMDGKTDNTQGLSLHTL